MAKDKKPSPLKAALDQSRHAFYMAAFFSLFINLLMLVPPIYMLQVYDRVLTSRSIDTLVMLTVIVVFLFLVMGGLEFVRSRILIRVGNRLDSQLNDKVFHSMFQRSLYQPARASAQPISDLTNMRQFLTGNGLFAFFDAPWVPIYIAVLFLFHPWLGVFATVAAIILFILAIANEYATRGLLGVASQESVQSRDFADHNLRNAEVVHAMGMQGPVRERWLSRHMKFLSAQSGASDRASVLSNVSKVFRLMAQSLILGLGGYLAVQQEITAGMLIAGSILMGRALAPIDLLIGSWKGFVSARSGYQRLNELLESFPQPGESMSLPAPEGRLSVESVTAAPPGSRTPTLRGVTFEVERGECIGVVGPSAAGKSTLARVMLGIWPTLAGAVRLDGADIFRWNREELGPHVGYLPQDIELFDGTVSENIARFGEIDADKVVEAARRAGVHEMILQLPNGYDTPVGAQGGVLSAGQRQRVGLARALYKTPAFVVLDEPNSNLDEQGEAALVSAIGEMKSEGSTVVLITHRPSILGYVDKILVMREGQAVVFGPRDEVLKKIAPKRARPAETKNISGGPTNIPGPNGGAV